MEKIIIEEKMYEREFLQWLLEVAPNFLIELLSKEKNDKKIVTIKEKKVSTALRKKQILALSTQKKLPFKILHHVQDELIVIFNWYQGEKEKDALLDSKEKIEVIRARYDENEVDSIQELALALFINKDFASAYELYERNDVAVEENTATNTSVKIEELENQLKKYEQRLKKYTDIEKENKRLKKEQDKLKKERVDANAEVRKWKKTADEKSKDNFTLKERVKELEATIASSEAAWEQDKQAKTEAIGVRDSLQRDLNEALENCNTLAAELAAINERKTYDSEIPMQEDLAEQLTKQLQENQLGTSTQKFTVITPHSPATSVVESLNPAVIEKKRTCPIAILGDPKGALYKLSDAKKEKIEIYDTKEMKQFIEEIEQYELAIVFELRCERQAFERMATQAAIQHVTFVKTVLELVQLMEEK